MANFKIPVSEYMSSPVLAVSPGASALEAERLLEDHDVSAIGVVDAGALVGVVSRSDLLNSASAESGQAFSLPDEAVRHLMTANPIAVAPTTPLDAVAKLMLSERIHRVFVEENGAPVGVCSTRDLMRAVHDQRVTTPAIDVATKGVVRAKVDDSLSLAIGRLDVSNKHGLVVVDGDWPVGTFSQVEALLARARDPRTPLEEVMNLLVLSVPPTMPLHRAAAQALALDVRRILLVDNYQIQGILSTYDFARVVR